HSPDREPPPKGHRHAARDRAARPTHTVPRWQCVRALWRGRRRRAVRAVGRWLAASCCYRGSFVVFRCNARRNSRLGRAALSFAHLPRTQFSDLAKRDIPPSPANAAQRRRAFLAVPTLVCAAKASTPRKAVVELRG